MSQVKIVGQKRSGVGQGRRRGGHFPRSGTKQHLELGAWRDRGSSAAQCAVFDPRSPVHTLRGYNSGEAEARPQTFNFCMYELIPGFRVLIEHEECAYARR